jgi:hypothetical protein
VKLFDVNPIWRRAQRKVIDGQVLGNACSGTVHGAWFMLGSRPCEFAARSSQGGLTMKSTFTIIAVGLLASSLATSADAATPRKSAGMAQLQAQCQAQAKKKYSAIHFLKRRAFVKSCMNQKA